jgi:hypothetical protein
LGSGPLSGPAIASYGRGPPQTTSAMKGDGTLLGYDLSRKLSGEG